MVTVACLALESNVQSLFDEHGYTWDTVVKAFTDKGLMKMMHS